VWTEVMLISAGLFAGSAIGFVWSRVPVWMATPIPQFVDDFSRTLRWTDKVQPVLLLVSLVSTIAFTFDARAGARVLALMAAAGFVTILVASVVVLVPLQQRIVADVDARESVEALRRRWCSGHIVRSAISLAAFVLAAVAAGM
jgi:hypothetical protein